MGFVSVDYPDILSASLSSSSSHLSATCRSVSFLGFSNWNSLSYFHYSYRIGTETNSVSPHPIAWDPGQVQSLLLPQKCRWKVIYNSNQIDQTKFTLLLKKKKRQQRNSFLETESPTQYCYIHFTSFLTGKGEI